MAAKSTFVATTFFAPSGLLGTLDLLPRGLQVALDGAERVRQGLPFHLQRLTPLLRVGEFTGGPIPVEFEPPGLIAMLTHLTLELVEHGAGPLYALARPLFGGQALLQGLAGIGQLLFQRRAIGDGAFAILAQSAPERLVLAPLLLRALLAQRGTALPLFRDGELALQVPGAVALLTRQPSEFDATRLRRGASGVGCLTVRLGPGDQLVGPGYLALQFGQTAVERFELVFPRHHLACGQ